MQATGHRQQGTAFQRFATVTVAAAAMLGLAGCRQDMHNQPKFYPQRGTDFYADGRSARPQVIGTVARGQEDEGSYFRTGMVNGTEGEGLPIALTPELIARGQERYNLYCTACHSRTGNGRGMIVMRGYFPAGNLHTERLRQAPLGHFFNVITNGYGAMPDYSEQVTAQDRWAIAAYIRALQLSQHATAADAGGAHIETMEAVEQKEGFAADFVKDWNLPDMSGGVQKTQGMAPALPTPPQPMPAAAAEAAKPAEVSQANPKAAPLATALPDGAKATAKTAATAKLEATATAPSAAAPHAAAGDVANGQKLYTANCSVCHQPTRAGMPPMIPSLVGIVARVGAAHIHTQVANGSPTSKPPMPAFPQLSNENVNDIIAFLAASK